MRDAPTHGTKQAGPPHERPAAFPYGLLLGAMGMALILVPQGVLASVCGPVGGLPARRRSPRTTLLIAAH